MTNQELYEYVCDSVLDADSNIVTLLLRFKELAQRLGYAKGAAFAANELDGYIDQKPDNHRAVKYDVYADVSPIFGAPQSHVRLNDKQRLAVFSDGGKREYPVYWECRNGVVELDAALRQKSANVLIDRMYDAKDDEFGEDYTNVQIECTRVEIARLFHDIRTFVSYDIRTIGNEHSELISEKLPTKHAQEKMMTTININGSNNQVATAAGAVRQTMTLAVTKGDWNLLARVLAEYNISHEDQEQLKSALQAESEIGQGSTLQNPCFGSKVSAWLGMALGKIAQVGGSLALQTAAGVLSTAISKYYGLS